MRQIDDRDRVILAILQQDARTANAEIGRRVGLAPSAVAERIKRLEADGVLRGFVAQIDPRAVGLGLLAFVFVRADERPSELGTAKLLAEIPEVQEIHHIAGEDCYLLKVRARSPEALGLLLRERFGAIPQVRTTRTTIVLETMLEASRIPLDAGGSDE